MTIAVQNVWTNDAGTEGIIAISDTGDHTMTDPTNQPFPERYAGYPTAEHRNALISLGITVHHRRSFGPVKAVLAATV